MNPAERPDTSLCGVRLAIDWGKARIGVAASDRDAILAFPVETVYTADRPVQRLAEIVAERWKAAAAGGRVAMDAVLDADAVLAANEGAAPLTELMFARPVDGAVAVLIAREFPGRRRVWPYLLGGVVVSLLGFATLYFGAYWLSDVIGGMRVKAGEGLRYSFSPGVVTQAATRHRESVKRSGDRD